MALVFPIAAEQRGQDNWLALAVVIAVILTAAATLLGPVLAVIVQVRMNNPERGHEPTQHKSPFEGSWVGAHLGLLCTVGASVSCVVLVFGILSSKPQVTPRSTYFIAFGIINILANVLMFMHQNTWRILDRQISELRRL